MVGLHTPTPGHYESGSLGFGGLPQEGSVTIWISLTPFTGSLVATFTLSIGTADHLSVTIHSIETWEGQDELAGHLGGMYSIDGLTLDWTPTDADIQVQYGFDIHEVIYRIPIEFTLAILGIGFAVIAIIALQQHFARKVSRQPHATTLKPATRRCPYCNAIYKEGDRTCGHCGAKL